MAEWMRFAERSGSEELLVSSSGEYREMPIDVEGLEDIPPRRKPRRPPKIPEEGDKDTRIIVDGLQLSLKGQKQPFVSFSYALTPLMDGPVRVDWKILTAEGVECQHVRYHQLQKGDNLTSLALKYRKSHAVAIILVNTDDSYHLLPEFTEDVAVMKMKKGSFPVVLVTSEDGRNLKDFLNRHDPGELNAKIASKDMDHVELLSQQAPTGTSYSPTTLHRTGFKGIRRSFRYRSTRKLAINLKDEIKQLMFPPSGPLCVSEDEGLFKVVMSTFYQHEQMVMRREGHHSGGAFFHKLNKHMEEMFARDFPFYLLVAYRVHKKQQLYQCDELSPFVHNCIERFEKLEQVSIARTLENFLKMENFKIMFDQKDATSTVFHLLEEACLELMRTSLTVHSQESSTLPHRYVYYRMLWITVSCKCHVERGSREPVDYWKDHLVTASHKLLHMNTETIHDVKKGVEFGRLLQLPDEVVFSSDHMADLLITEGSIRPFNQMREFVLNLEPYVQLEEDFVRNFIKKPRESYEQCFQQSVEEGLRAVQPEGNILVILQEGIGFLDTVLEVCRKRQWRSDETDTEMKQWLTLLMELVDVTSERAESCLKDFLTTKTGGVTKQYCEHIKREVICKVEENFGHLPIEQFLQLYKAFLIWPNWVLERYLKQYKIPKGVKVCGVTWNELFAEFVERFTDAHHHNFLLEFLKSVAACYLEQGRAKDFILDLLHLDVPRLFVTESDGNSSVSLTSDALAASVPDEFTNFLTDYIQRNSLGDDILEEVETIWGAIVEHSDFQQLILFVLQQELIPASLSLHGTLSEPVRVILKHCVTTICAEIASLQDLSSRLNFCWGIVASCCDRIPVSNNYDWIANYRALFYQFSRIYGTYCEHNHMEEGDRILKTDSFPPDVTDSPCEDVKKFFSWVCSAQQVIVTWQNKLESKHVNFDEIHLYLKHFSQINRLGSEFSAEGLVMDTQSVQALKQEFLQNFEVLNMFLIRYISGQPDAGWCSLQFVLSKYGVGFPTHLHQLITKHVTLPGETKSTAKKSPGSDHHLLASVSKTFLPGLDVALEITRDLELCEIKSLIQVLSKFLEPIENSKVYLTDMLVFFHLQDSEIFDKYLRLQLQKLDTRSKPAKPVSSNLFMLPAMVPEKREEHPGVSIRMLSRALEQTRELLLKLICGTASYSDIIADGSLHLKSLDIDREFEILNRYALFAKIDDGNPEGLEGVKAMLQLFQFTRHIQTIHGVCQQYHLEGCLEDPDLQELVDLVNTLEVEENRDKLTAKDAIDKMERVSQSLCLEKGQNLKFLDLFAAVADSTAFHQFIVKDKGFVGEHGQVLFRQQYQLITTQLQHEEYKEIVLNHLIAAFKFIMPFTDCEQDFHCMMVQVSTLNAYDARRQLETVNRNINLIRLWFSRAEGDTLQGVATELGCVLNTGCYRFVFNSSTQGVAASVQLHYRPVALGSQEAWSEGGPIVSVRDAVEQTWNDEQISDFVRKLGFLDAEGAEGEKINHFLHLHQTAKKLLDLYSKLRELGHPSYLLPVLRQVLPCSLEQKDADQKVYDAAKTLSKWEQDVAQLRSQYDQLLFFTIPKLLHLYQLIMAAGEPDLEGIVQEVGFLFQNKPHVREKLKETVQELLATKQVQLKSPTDTPMHTVGAFLSSLFKNFELSSHSLKRRRPSVPSRTNPSQSTHILHSCKGYSQGQLLRLIISIYGGVPEAFEVFHCRATTTEEELRLFLNPRRATKRPFQYLILEVNRLPYQLQEALLRLHFDLKQQELPCVHFIETDFSLLQEMPWILHRDYKDTEPSLDFAQAMMTCKKSALNPDDFSCVQLVYGIAGDGKTHYIEGQLNHCPEHVKVAVNEAFTPLSAIKKLSTLPSNVPGCAVCFNFTMLPPGESVDDEERKHYVQLIETIGWFFFHLFILGYVEDPLTGNSFRFPGGMQWAVYIEAPSRNNMSSEESLGEFYEDVPALGLLGTPHCVYPQTPYVVDDDAQLVCKYLKAYKVGGTKGINRLYKESSGFLGSKGRSGIPVKFSQDPDLSEAECRRLLDRYTPQHMKKNKTTQKLFVRYMKRRCAFLDNCPAFNYNSGSTEYIEEGGVRKKNDTKELGSTLMDTMLKEVSDFCDPIIREDWSLKPHHQLVYDFKDGGGSFGLMSLHPDQIPHDDKEKFRKIGVEIPNMMELYSRERLDSFLSRALDIPLDENHRLTAIDDSAYVLTLDFAIKMLNIHERAECQIPVIIEGETGVGKTALVEMLSKLWNYSLIKSWNVQKERLLEYITRKLAELPPENLKGYEGSMDAIASLNAGEPIREDHLILIGEPCDASGVQFYCVLRDEMLRLMEDPVLSLIELREEDREDGKRISQLFAAAKFKDNAKDTAKLLFAFLNAKVKSTFHKLNVHSAVQPANIASFFEPVFKQAKELSAAYEGSGATKIPFVTVFLDEVNTTSCLGLLKEIIVDRTLDGQPIPPNIFIIGACNPHRGNSLAALDTWVRGSYYVRQLHPTLHCLMWDYGALGEIQEQDYIRTKMKMFNKNSSNVDLTNLTDLIVTSQNLMRKYAIEQLKACGLPEHEASPSARSCVSQRDIQRVFTFYEWLMNLYTKFKPHGDDCDYSSRAVLVSLGLVYYLRLDSHHRMMYREKLDHETALTRSSFSKVFEEELNWFIDQINLPEGIAKTQALKENLFANVVCTMTHTPLIIVGAPGSSKTLSFNLTLANLKGEESKMPVFRHTDIFRSLDPHFYQCSRRTTSNEISTVFSRAINRQRSHRKVPLPVYCVVFMDEAGLPEERHESLKVLHYFLDSQEVSFVAITNHVLDAAKTNRAVSLYRPEASEDDLVILAKGCLCTDPNPPPELRKDIEIATSFCPAYRAIMSKEKFGNFFGLRDFIHFISYLRRKRMKMLSPHLVMEALERNFNGVDSEDFKYISHLFLRAVHSSPEKVESRNILDILRSSLNDHAISGAENEVRYKLIIDPSEDGSLVRLLFSSGVLQRENTRVYVCSDFPGDAQLQKVNTIAAIRHSATQGHTVIMSQTDAVHESFYDLFNRRFHRIDANPGPRYYANIAIGAHIKPCRVHPDFECVVVVKHSEVKNIPPPFLNRFEKYYLSHERVLEAALSHLPPCFAQVFKTAQNKAEEFLEHIGGSSSIYGLQKDTVNSLVLTLLPPSGFKFRDHRRKEATGVTDIKAYLLEMLLQALRENAGFYVPTCSDEELQLDTEEVFRHVLRDGEFAGRMSKMTPESVHTAISEALHALYNTSSCEAKTDISASACLVVAVFTQWLTRHLCKRLTQLMTSEALCMHHRKIPSSYIQNYLNYQHHFSLRAMLELQQSLLNSETKPSCSTKLLCFTRSSQLLHQLPTQYPSATVHTPTTDSDNLLQELAFHDLKQLVVHKLSTVTSYTSMNELLKSFLASESQNIMLLVVNMQETKKEVVNHLRIMIEEAESRNPNSRKLFVVLLHFPASHLTSPCYPSMFLQGWDFYYLDIIGYSPKGGILDIRDWFRQCYFTPKTGSLSPDDSVTLQLNTLLREAIQVVSSRVFFGSHRSSSFNRPMGLPERTGTLEELFLEKGVGDILCERFRSYWHPSVMVDYLEKAAAFAQQHETTLNVVDSLQTIFRGLFFDFLVHMVSKINEGMNLDIIFTQESCSPAVKKLFLDLLRIYPIPKLSELRMLRIASDTCPMDKSKDTFSPPKFPFFHLVSSAVEKLVDQSRREVNQQQVEVLGDRSDAHLSLFQSSAQGSQVQTMADMLNRVQTKLEDLSRREDTSILGVTLHALLDDNELWQKYLEDFTHQKLHLDFSSTGISHKILQVAFGKLEERDALHRLAILHVYVHIHKLNLAKVVSILRPLDKIEVAASIFPSLSEKVQSPTQSFLHSVEHSGDFLGRPEALSIFIIDTLFSAIAGIGMSYTTPVSVAAGAAQMPENTLEQLKVWYKVYRDVMSMPTLKEHIYRSRLEGAEAQHNVMHTLFLVLRSKPAKPSPDDLHQGLAIFNQLFNRFFWSSLELRKDSPRLGDIAKVTLETMTGSELSSALAKDSPQVRHTIEGLLEHFFSEHLMTYHPDDISWFLRIANQQTHWQATFLMNEVIGVEYSVDLLSQLDFEPSATAEREPPIHKLASCVPMSVFKFYLHRILLQVNLRSSDDPVHSILFFFHKSQVHSLITDVLCDRDDASIPPAPYIPAFYQYCDPLKPCYASDNQLMQQPLSHLYFLTMFENVLNSDFNLSAIIRTVNNMTKQCDGGSVSDRDLVLLYIEKQAVVQVMIMVLAQHLDLKKDSKINVICNLLPDLNTILDDESMGGGEVGGHGLVLAMHMLRELHSFQRFTSMLTEHYSMLCDGINCLRPFHKALTSPTKPDPPFLPYADMGQDFHTLYQRLTTILSNIHTSHGATAKVKELTRLTTECYQDGAQFTITGPSGDALPISKANCFKMVLWLSIYNEFFSKKKTSQTLSQVIRNMDHLETQVARLLSAFVYPEYMVKKSGTSEPYHDIIYNLFMPHSSGREDPSDCDLRNALVHMVAVVLGCPPYSVHLWYHMFLPDELKNTYITGFMYNSTVGPSTQVCYDQGVELTDSGLYGQHGYLQHATRGTLSLHSLYLLLWSNFAAFSMGLLTQHDVERKLSEGIISESQPVRLYCTTQLQKMWGLIQSGLGISDDERSLLVRGCLNNLFELQLKSPSSLSGKLQAPSELDRYEEMWHSVIFTPQWNCLKKESLHLLQNSVFKDIRQVDVRYPWFPSEQTLAQSILSLVNISDPSTNDLYALSQFMIEYPRLRIGGNLLPGTVELYQWLHTELAYSVMYEEATSITLGRLASVVAKRFSGDRRQHYEKLKAAFNDYVHLTGCTRNKRPVTISDDTAILHLFSYTMDGEQGNDLLYCVITDVIAFHNEFLSGLLQAMGTSSSLYARYFPEGPPRVHSMEFTQQYRLVGRSSSMQSCDELLQLIHSRSYLPDAFPTDPRSPSPRGTSHSNLPGQMAALIDLSKLQEDILGAYIVGKPLIELASMSAMRIPFNFKEDPATASLHLDLRDSAVHTDSISEKLPERFRVPLEDTYRKRLEYEFHSAGYHAIMEVVNGFRTAIGHLIREITSGGASPSGGRQTELHSQSLPEFLITLYEIDSQDDSRDVFHEIGLHSLTPSQHSSLETLTLPFLYHALKLFVQWAEEGWYDFCSLPFAAKMQMSLPDEDTLRQIRTRYEGTTSELLRELKSLVDVLIHLEGNIARMAQQNSQQSIVKYLKSLQILSIEDKFVSMIPETVRLEHYVALRLVLRKLISDIQKQLSHRGDIFTPEPQEEKWDDFISDLWETKLPQFRQRDYVYMYPTLSAGSVTLERETSHSSEILNELIRYTSEANLLEDNNEPEELPSSPSLPPTPQKPPSDDGSERQLKSSRVLFRKLTSQVEDELQQRAKRYNMEDVIAFLQTINLDQYVTAFEEFEINGELLIQFRDDELKEMGVLSALHRLKIRIYFRRQVLNSQEAEEQWPPQMVAEFLERDKQLKVFASIFLENKMDGELLLNASDDVMKELGVEKGVHMRMIRTRFKSYIAV